MQQNQMTGRVKGVSFSTVTEGEKEVVKARIVFESTASDGMADYLTGLLKRECLMTLQPVQISFVEAGPGKDMVPGPHPAEEKSPAKGKEKAKS